MYLLDTNVLIDFMNNRNPILTETFLSHHPADLTVSAISVFELEFGAAKSNLGEKTRQKMAMFLAPFSILPFAADDAYEAALVRAFLKKSGTIIGPYDVQLAGQAIAKKMTFVTHNTREFTRVQGLTVEDWAVL